MKKIVQKEFKIFVIFILILINIFLVKNYYESQQELQEQTINYSSLEKENSDFILSLKNELNKAKQDSLLLTEEITILQSQIEEMDNPTDWSIDQDYDSPLLSFANLNNVSLYRIPDENSESVGVINGKVLVYTVVMLRDETKKFPRWAYVQYVGNDGISDGTSDSIDGFGYVKAELLDYVAYEDEEITSFGISGLYIGSTYEDVVSELGRNFTFTKNMDKGWSSYHPEYDLAVIYDSTNLCVEHMILNHPQNFNLKINEQLSTQSNWSDFLLYLDDYIIKDVTLTGDGNIYYGEQLDAIIDNEILINIHYEAKTGNIISIKISKVEPWSFE